MNQHAFPTEQCTGLILAGGQGARMDGQDKGLLPLLGKPLIQYSIECLRPYVDQIFISANRNLPTYSALGCPVIADQVPGFNGPLTGLMRLLQQVKTPYAICLPCDTPLLPTHLLQVLWQHLHRHSLEYVYAQTRDRPQPLVACMKTSVQDSLHGYVQTGGQRVFQWVQSLASEPVSITANAWELENINDADQLKCLEATMAKETR